MIIPVYNHIPLEKDPDNWWYFGRLELLKLLIKPLDKNKINNILEIGPGLGINIKLLSSYGTVDILEIDQYFVDQIKKSNKKINHFSDISQIDKKFDLIVMMDVLEHIEDSENFINDLSKILNFEGSLILSVPAYPKLFSDHDIQMKHFRRYTKKMLTKELSNNFKNCRFYRYNFILLPIRILQIRFNKKVNSKVETSKLLNFLLKNIIKIEIILHRMNMKVPYGLSIFCVAKKI